jgi:hypothetical protein
MESRNDNRFVLDTTRPFIKLNVFSYTPLNLEANFHNFVFIVFCS